MEKVLQGLPKVILTIFSLLEAQMMNTWKYWNKFSHSCKSTVYDSSERMLFSATICRIPWSYCGQEWHPCHPSQSGAIIRARSVQNLGPFWVSEIIAADSLSTYPPSFTQPLHHLLQGCSLEVDKAVQE